MINFFLDIGRLPIVSTAIEAIHDAITDEQNIDWLLDNPTAITAKRESPAPATSTGLTDKAGKE